MMKKSLFTAVAVVVLGSVSYASPINCVGATLAQVIASSGHDCVLNDLLFTFNTPVTASTNPPYPTTPESYSYYASKGAQPSNHTGSDVNLISSAPDSLTFQTADWATRGSATPSNSQVRTIDIVYTVQIYNMPGKTVTGLSSSIPLSGPGTETAKCTSGCTGTVTFTNATTPVAVSPATAGPVTIEDKITLGSATSTLSSHLSTLTNTFQVNGGSNFSLVPEPSMMLLTAAGMALVGFLRMRKSS